MKTRLLLFACLFVASCSNNPKDLIVNKWKLVDIQGSTSKYLDSVKQRIMANTTIEFAKDGKYNTSSETMADNGTYSLEKNGKSIKINSLVTGTHEYSDIDTLTRNRLVITDERGTRFVMEPK